MKSATALVRSELKLKTLEFWDCELTGFRLNEFLAINTDLDKLVI